MQGSAFDKGYLEALDALAEKIECEVDFEFFIRYVFKEYYKIIWVHNWHHDAIIRLIYQIEARLVPNAVINIPPRYGKTEIVVILWICWTLIRNPCAKFIHVSYSDELALQNSAKARDILRSPCIQKHWPLKMKDSTDSKGLWETEQGGGVKAGAAGGAVTGFGAGITSWKPGEPFDGAIISDDPLKADDAKSEAMRKTVNERHSGTLHSRKNHPLVPMVIVMQRLHTGDPSGYALDGGIMGDTFAHLRLPALGDDGKALWPLKHTREKLLAMQGANQESRLTFAGQYQQQPYTPGGLIFKLEWFGRYTRLPQKPDRKMVLHSWDTAYKPQQHNDPSCGGSFHCTSSAYYLANVVNGRWEYPDLKKRVVKMAEDDPPDAVLIEDKASGQSLIQDLRRETRLPVIPIKPVGDKETRARTAAAVPESGRMLLPEEAPWLMEYEQELIDFPNGINDDRVDMTSQALTWLNARGNDNYRKMMEELYG